MGTVLPNVSRAGSTVCDRHVSTPWPPQPCVTVMSAPRGHPQPFVTVTSAPRDHPQPCVTVV